MAGIVMGAGSKPFLVYINGHLWRCGFCVFWAFIAAIILSGCGEFFAEKPTVMESKAILADLRQIPPNPHIENTFPDLYREAPKRVQVADGIKLFYFTRHHPAGEMAANVGQLGYKVSQNASTNQLIIHCADDADADSVLEYLSRVDVPPIQINIDCLILERFGDVTTDWETTLMMENILGEGIKIGGKTDSTGSLIPNFPGASLREAKRGEFGLDIGYWIDKGVSGHQVRLLVDMLESRGYFKVLMNPTLETINGKPATVLLKDYAPIQVTVTSKGAGSDTVSYELTKYEWVEDRLTITPHVFSDGYIGLTASVQVGSKTKPEGIVQNPILTKRTIDVGETRIEPGKSLVIGGMRRSENRSVVRGVPFFKDLPIVGILFSSKDFEERATEIIFVLTPSVSSGGVSYEQMLKFTQDKYDSPEYETGLTEFFTDPLGTGIYTELVEEEATRAEAERARAEIKRINAEDEAQEASIKAELTLREAERLKGEAEKAKAQAEAARQQAIETGKLAQAAQAQAESEKEKAAAIIAERDKTAAEVAQAKAQANQAEQAAKEAADQAQQAEERAKKAMEDAAKAQAEAEQAKAAARKAAE